MAISLTPTQIDAALPKIAAGLGQYCQIQKAVQAGPEIARDASFRKSFNRFYRVRRPPIWQTTYYTIMEEALRTPLSFDSVLVRLHKETGNYEASFASKLVATITPSSPVIDSIVLSNVGLRLPLASRPDRAAAIGEVYQQLTELFRTFLLTETGAYLVVAFRRSYPEASITPVKMLDLVLWRTQPGGGDAQA